MQVQVYKQAHDKRGIEESLHVYTNWARLTVCEVGVFSEKYQNSQKYIQPSHVHCPRVYIWEIMVLLFQNFFETTDSTSRWVHF